MRLAFNLLPTWFGEFTEPIDCQRTLPRAIFEPACVDRLRSGLPSLRPRRAERMDLTRPERVFQSKFERVQIHFPYNAFHVSLDRPVALWDSVTTVRS